MGLADDFHAAALQLVDRIDNTIHTNAQVVPSGKIVASVEIFARWAFRGAGARQNSKLKLSSAAGEKKPKVSPPMATIGSLKSSVLLYDATRASKSARGCRTIDFPRRERATGIGGRRGIDVDIALSPLKANEVHSSSLTKCLALDRRANGRRKFGLAFERQPVAGGQVRHGKILARAAHGLSEAIVGDVAKPVEAAIHKQHGLAQPSAVRRSVGVDDIGGVVQIPGVARSKSGCAERFDQGVEVGERPEHGSGGTDGARCAEPNQPPLRLTKADR